MNKLIVGDVHGCYNTLKKLLHDFWNKDSDLLIFLGDIIDRGNFSPETASYCKKLSEEYPNRVIVLKGNHELEFESDYFHGANKNWLGQCGLETKEQYLSRGFSIKKHALWFKNLPLYYEDSKIFISHAGISIHMKDIQDENCEQGILWNRSEIKNIHKLQVYGHTPIEEISFNKESNSWNIDTGAAYNNKLSAVKFSSTGSYIGSHSEKVLEVDISK